MALRLILGFDYGTKQIGVAVGQVITGQARELCVLKAQNGVPDWQKVEALIKEWQPDAIVVGLPLGVLLHTFVLMQIRVDMVSFKAVIAPVSFLLTVVMVVLFTVITDLVMRKKIAKIDMAESLKSIE